MSSTLNRKIVARFPTLLEAQAAVTALEASGIYAIVNNEVVGGMMPHASNALGGFHVSVDSDKESEARSLLEGAVPEETLAAEPESVSRRVNQMMKRATYGAAMGLLFAPLIANIFSLWLLARAYRLSREEFWRNKTILFLGVFFNFAVFAVALLFAFWSWRGLT